jgi:20S proteasome subunit alpha 2
MQWPYYDLCRYYNIYREVQPVSQLVRDTAGVMQEYTQSGGVRPFGVSLLVAGYDDDGPQLYQVQPFNSQHSTA